MCDRMICTNNSRDGSERARVLFLRARDVKGGNSRRLSSQSGRNRVNMNLLAIRLETVRLHGAARAVLIHDVGNSNRHA